MTECGKLFWLHSNFAKVEHLNIQSLLGLSCLISILMGGTAFAQGKPKPAQTQAGPCVIAEFRHIAMTHHDPQERQYKVIEWLQRNGISCSPVQLSILISSKASLLGTSDGGALDAVIDHIVEKKMGSDHAAVSRYYRPDAQGVANSKEEGATKTIQSGPAPSPVVSAPGVGAVAGMQLPNAIAMASSPTSLTSNINMAGTKLPDEDMSRKYPLATEPMFSFPPANGTPLLNYFGKIRRQFVRSFFMETLSPGKCPEGMAWRNDACEASISVAWKFGEKLPQGAKTYPVDPKLVEKLNFDPGYMFVRVGGDILALERDTGKVADAVLNLGKAT
jgi:hypothetical protein